MHRALELAQRAGCAGEVPVGALVVYDHEIIGEGWNQSIGLNDPTGHAEILALRAAAVATGNYRLPDTTLYVTVEPCMMCLGASIHARIAHICYGALEPKAGALVSRSTGQREHFNHFPQVIGGVLAEPCGSDDDCVLCDSARAAAGQKRRGRLRCREIPGVRLYACES